MKSNRFDLKKVSIYNMLGKEVKVITPENSKQTMNVNVENLSSGIYVVKVTTELGTFHKKIIRN